MTPAFQLRFNCLELGHQPLLCRLPPDDERSILPALPTVVREAQKREGLRLSLSPLRTVESGEPPEPDQPCLLRMQFQAELRQALPEFFQESFGLRSAFETHHQIVSIPDDNDIALSHFLAPGFGPQVEYVMQVDVRQQR